MIGNVTTAIVRCCWKPWWMGTAFAERATERPTGSMWERPPAAAAWTATTTPTAKRSKMFTFIRWCATRGSSYAAISRGKQIRNFILVWFPADKSYHHNTDLLIVGTYSTGAVRIPKSTRLAVTDKRVMYVPPVVRSKMVELGVQPGELFTICKAERKQGNRR